ncbi:putative ankyrin repeat protein RF_0381 [Haliotis rubra]|uniref:putative ankyrin repeat protein RF_0381 n=1 Tax=Haliotis rubra TaxID=36100 RepID=UPI001EE53BFC|nr:putative ankyrin repeat protein RF_0381 [Haliotis rubra]
MLLWMRSNSPSLTETSGYHSTPGSASSLSDVHDQQTESGYAKEHEGQLPHITLGWEVQDGNMKLIAYNYNSILIQACLDEKLVIVKRLLSSSSVDINKRTKGGWTPVLIAAHKGNMELLTLLVKQKCDLSLTLDNGENILHVACSRDNVDIVEYVFSHRIADIDSRDRVGRTPVLYAAGKGNKKIVDLLVSKGCNLSVVDDQGRNILHAACLGDNEDIVKDLLSRGIADIDSRDDRGKTPAMYATEKGNKKVVDLLVSKGCNLSVVDNLGGNILHVACLGDNEDIVKDLLSRGIADIDSRDDRGRTPVMYAAEKGNKKVVDLLVSKGCNLSVVDNLGGNILHVACLGGNEDFVEDLLSRGIAGIDSRDRVGRTPVLYATGKGNKKIVDLLVSKGCNLSVVDDQGRNILHAACLGDNEDIVKDLLSRGIADIDSRDDRGKTPAMYATEKGYKKVVDLLVSKGCNLSVVDNLGGNILHVACLGDNEDIVKDLLSRGIADIDSRDDRGRTPVMYAAEKGNKKVVDLLIAEIIKEGHQRCMQQRRAIRKLLIYW